MGKEFLSKEQLKAVDKMFSGCILNGGVGTGKSRTGLYFYFKTCGGEITDNTFKKMSVPKDLYIITTAKKRDTLEWDGELAHFLLSTHDDRNEMYDNSIRIVVDSWNNIKKYKDIKNSFFIFDEQRVVGKGSWVRSFIKIAKNNEWILLTATPGDKWEDYAPVFIANGFYKNITDFKSQHLIMSYYSSYPKLERYIGVGRLIRLRNNILIPMNVVKHTKAHHISVLTYYDKDMYNYVLKYRRNPYKKDEDFNNLPIETASELCYTLRQIVNTDESKEVELLEILDKHPKAIIFYNFDYELEMLRRMFYNIDESDCSPLIGYEVAEWNGHYHQPVPDSDRWVYLVQYTAGCEGWNCIKTDTIIFLSQTYSYKQQSQAEGRIDRLDTPFTDLYYYHFRSAATIDYAILKSLNNKKDFNIGRFYKDNCESITLLN